MILIIEGLAMCFILLIVCVIGIAYEGPVGLVTFYEQDVKRQSHRAWSDLQREDPEELHSLRHRCDGSHASVHPRHGLWDQRR